MISTIKKAKKGVNEKELKKVLTTKTSVLYLVQSIRKGSFKMDIKKILGLSIAFNGAFIALASTNIYHTNVMGLVIGGLIMLVGGYLIVKESL